MPSAKYQFPITKPREQGMASIVVVFMLVVLLALISVSFAKIMDRSLQTSVANQAGSAAVYAAESAINDTIDYLNENPKACDDGKCDSCQSLIGPSKPLAAKANLSADGFTKYSCLTVDPKPDKLTYQNLTPYKSQVVPLEANNMTSLLFSWQSANRAHTVFPPAQKWYDQAVWSQSNYVAAVSLTIYKVPSGSGDNMSQAKSMNLVLYPQASGTNDTINYSSTVNPALKAVNCNIKPSFPGGASSDCNVVIDGLSGSNNTYYLRIMPLYDQTSVEVKAANGNTAISFSGNQVVIDATARSGNSVKRLQAQVDLATSISGDDNALPEYGLRSAATICKRLKVSNTGKVSIDSGSPNCPFSF